ncbi:MAG: RHS repeat-associated core domain-containing protein, partial [Rhizomicrobium sp.]
AAAKTGMSATYAYDPAGRRMSKTVTGGSYAGTTFFLDAGDDEVAEYDVSGALLRRYVPGRGVDQPIAMVTAAGAKSFFHQDKTGSVIAMSDTSGNIATNNGVADGPYTYDAYGNCLIGGAACSGGVPYKYTGRRYDPETGLYFNRARFYSAAVGRFLQTDPIGYGPDLDWYTYVANDPTDKTDPSGLEYISNTAPYHICFDPEDPLCKRQYAQLDTRPMTPAERDRACKMGGCHGYTADQNRRMLTDKADQALARDVLVFVGTTVGSTVIIKGIGAAASITRAEGVADSVMDFLGPGATRVERTGSDLMLRSADGTRSIRFDLINSHGDAPHINLEMWENANRFPGDTRMTQIMNEHIYPVVP